MENNNGKINKTNREMNEYRVEIRDSYNGIAGGVRLYIDGSKSSYYHGGCGYCRKSAALAEWINNIIDEEIIKNIKSYKGGTENISYGIGISAISNIIKELGGNIDFVKENKKSQYYIIKI